MFLRGLRVEQCQTVAVLEGQTHTEVPFNRGTHRVTADQPEELTARLFSRAAMTLNIYGHLFPDRLDEVADVLDLRRTAALDKRAA